MKSKALIAVLAVLVVLSNMQEARTEDCFNCFHDAFGWFCWFATPGYYWCYAWGDGCEATGACGGGGGGGGCFLSGTKVTTETGLKAIEELEVGDRVLGLDGTNNLVPCEVTKTIRYIGCSYYVINGRLRVTGTHPFWVDGKWVEASSLKVGDELKGVNLEPIMVESIELVKKAVRAYNIEVAEAHTFFANGVLVHNKGPDPGLP